MVLLGPPASGKGTQAELIQKRFGIPATSTGAILRREAKCGTPVGVAANKIISRGGLAPDGLILELVGEWLEKIGDSFLFDGFPRTVAQAEQFELFAQQPLNRARTGHFFGNFRRDNPGSHVAKVDLFQLRESDQHRPACWRRGRSVPQLRRQARSQGR